jgi:Family of unknown function (DUF6510)
MRLDGNVLAGPLSEVYDREMTAVLGRCRGCDDVAALAQAIVHLGAGFVLRCRSCDAVLLTVVVRRDLPPIVTSTGVSGLD